MTGRPAVPVVDLSEALAADVRSSVTLFGATYASSAVLGYVRQLDERALAGDMTGAAISLALARATVRAVDDAAGAGGRPGGS